MSIANGIIELPQTRSFLRMVYECFSFRRGMKSSVEVDPDTFYNPETEFIGGRDVTFMWSRPVSRILVSNRPSITIAVEAPWTQIVKIEYGCDVRLVTLRAGRSYIINIDTKYIDYVDIKAETYLPVDDTRELGLKFLNVE